MIPIKLQRMYKHILESYLDRGLSPKEAARRAAATVNKRRASLASGKRICKTRRRRRVCRIIRGPRLVGRGGSRRQWWPGKKTMREKFVCLEHGRRFKTKAGMTKHYIAKHYRQVAGKLR
jgi:hypothetical protein